MTKPFLFLLAAFFLLACAPPTRSGKSYSSEYREPATSNQNTEAELKRLLSLNDAEKILGEPTHLSDSSTMRKEKLITFHCAYKATAEDVISGKTGAVYFVAEQYDNASLAHQKYSSIKTANDNHEGVKALDSFGDEAYYHSDGENFHFIMARKGAKVIIMKVNKITSKTSKEGFFAVARSITDAL